MLLLQSAVISDEKAAEFRRNVYNPIALSHVVEYVLYALGGLCIVLAVVLALVSVSKKKLFEMRIQVRKNVLYDGSFCVVQCCHCC